MFCCASLKSVKKKEVILKNSLRKGIVILDNEVLKNPVWAFEA